jgi:hypothetical protein
MSSSQDEVSEISYEKKTWWNHNISLQHNTNFVSRGTNLRHLHSWWCPSSRDYACRNPLTRSSAYRRQEQGMRTKAQWEPRKIPTAPCFGQLLTNHMSIGVPFGPSWPIVYDKLPSPYDRKLGTKRRCSTI